MGGGLMQLVAYGAQDIYLTGNPQITFFKVVYRRHTNFSMEAIEQTFNGGTGSGGRATATISRNGDLVHRMYLEMPATLEVDNAAYAGVNPGTVLIDNIECEIGGQRIDRQYGHWMEAWAELTEPNSAAIIGLSATGAAGLAAVLNNTGTKYQNLAKAGGVTSIFDSADGTALAASITPIVPLQFWFCRNPGLALPLIALQYHEVKIIVNFATNPSGLVRSDGTAKLYADYIYLDTDERRRFAQVSHEYLIEQVQHQAVSSNVPDITLNFNHPVKELVWAGATNSLTGVRDQITGDNVLLKLNGHDRFSARPTSYFTQTQVWQHHTGTPIITNGSEPALVASRKDGVGKASVNEIAVYSFALKPEEHQPSGTCNFSRIDNAQLKGVTATGLNVYAVNYNVLRIMSGMGGLAYSN